MTVRDRAKPAQLAAALTLAASLNGIAFAGGGDAAAIGQILEKRGDVK